MEIINLKVEQYEGPLDLLLALISKHKIDIFDIPIAEIAEQYTATLDAMRELDMEVTSDFLVMAAELMLIKSRMLLPRTEDSEDPRAPLVDALLEHQRAVAAAQFLKNQSLEYFDSFTKPASEPEKTDYSRNHGLDLLAEAFARIAERIAARKDIAEPKLFKALGEERYYTVEEKTEFVTEMMSRVKSCRFEELFADVRSRGEAVAVFLAILECMHDGRLCFERENDDIIISLAEETAETSAEAEALNEYK